MPQSIPRNEFMESEIALLIERITSACYRKNLQKKGFFFIYFSGHVHEICVRVTPISSRFHEDKETVILLRTEKRLSPFEQQIEFSNDNGEEAWKEILAGLETLLKQVETFEPPVQYQFLENWLYTAHAHDLTIHIEDTPKDFGFITVNDDKAEYIRLKLEGFDLIGIDRNFRKEYHLHTFGQDDTGKEIDDQDDFERMQQFIEDLNAWYKKQEQFPCEEVKS